MSVKDVIKSSILDSLAGAGSLTTTEIVIILFLTCVIGTYIFFVYKGFSHGEFYSKDINITIALMSVIVAAIMIAMQSNLLVSLGMVGALSIVRFRTAIKNPMDLLYLFWSISAGIICGVGLYSLAFILCAILTIAIWLLGKVRYSKALGVMVIKASSECDLEEIYRIIKDNSKYVSPKSTQIIESNYELIYEVSISDVTELLTKVKELGGIKSVNWVEHNGEIRN